MKTHVCYKCQERKKESEIFVLHAKPYKRKTKPGSYVGTTYICKECQHKAVALTRLRKKSISELHGLLVKHDRLITIISEVIDEKKKLPAVRGGSKKKG